MSNEDVPVDIVASAIGIRIARGKRTVVEGTENTCIYEGKGDCGDGLLMMKISENR